MNYDVEERVVDLELVLARFIRKTEQGFDNLHKEMLEFKDEMREFKDEMGEFKDEMGEFKDEMREDSRKKNEAWGHLSNRLGTLVEDIVIPSFPKVIKELYDLEIDEVLFFRKKKHPVTKQSKEFDGIVIAGDFIFLNSTKTRLKYDHIDEFKNDIELFRGYFPEYNSKKVVGFFASLSPDEGFIPFAEKDGFYVLGLGDWLMELKNSKDFKPIYY